MEKDNLMVDCIINIQAYKYNGELYRQWNGVKIIENSPEHVVLHMDKTKVSEKENQNWTIRETSLWFMPKNKMYNAIITFKNDQPYVYINLASSFIYEDNTIKYIDYDLDIKCYPGKDFYIIDKLDFKRNTIKMHYPKQLHNKIYSTIKFLFNNYIQDEYIFNKSYLKTFLEEIKREKLQKWKKFD
ncbi:DUF402 domain-containing protein [Mycoplasma iguanae]|uniref:DUF402 domain-containing protein n=1 Tax=Mycoplasma iguanae TaxID=292461 RepID=A0ABY5R9U3_9MOLU|nr:DUF402 domain-containing protein [Mycoplasma iguanae]UVD81549.1 DUF402 domain-containing protein [Mycoplasma iguanae]